MEKAKILLILTGGTICSFGDDKNENRDVQTKKAERLLLKNFQESDSPYRDCDFDVEMILDILSENMTVGRWNRLIAFLKQTDLSKYQGVIIAHGTDTLAYTSNLLSLVLSGTAIPVFLVSSNLPLNNSQANGNVNFKTAVELICTGMDPGVYVPFQNEDGICYLHKGCNLMQSGNYSQNFYSQSALKVSDIADIPRNWYQVNAPIVLKDMGELKDDVLAIRPYVGLNYRWFQLDSGIRAVVHGLYHAETACVTVEQEEESHSILFLLKECRKRDIPVIIEPSREDQSFYITNSEMVENGAVPVYGMTSEMVYVKTLVAGALGYGRKDLIEFLRKDVCGEMIDS